MGRAASAGPRTVGAEALTADTIERATGEAKDLPRYRIAVLVPCYNEEAAVATVVAALQATLPAATIYVYDNNPSDRHAEIARASCALVRLQLLRRLGHIVRRLAPHRQPLL